MTFSPSDSLFLTVNHVLENTLPLSDPLILQRKSSSFNNDVLVERGGLWREPPNLAYRIAMLHAGFWAKHKRECRNGRGCLVWWRFSWPWTTLTVLGAKFDKVLFAQTTEISFFILKSSSRRRFAAEESFFFDNNTVWFPNNAGETVAATVDGVVVVVRRWTGALSKKESTLLSLRVSLTFAAVVRAIGALFFASIALQYLSMNTVLAERPLVAVLEQGQGPRSGRLCRAGLWRHVVFFYRFPERYSSQ